MSQYHLKSFKYMNKLTGGNLDKIILFTEELNNYFGDTWCYTGSVAVYLYALKFNIDISPNYIIQDFDVIYVPDSCSNMKPMEIGHLKQQKYTDTNSGIPFYDINGIKQMDLICSNKINYYELIIKEVKFNLISPKILLGEYKNINVNNETVYEKINIIQKVIYFVNEDDIKTYSNKQKRLNENISPIKQPSFGDSPIKQPSFGDSPINKQLKFD
jgi:hypothetical protein